MGDEEMEGSLKARRKQEIRNKRRNRIVGIAIPVIVVIAIIVVVAWLMLRPRVKEELVVEAGSVIPQAMDFLEKDRDDVRLVTDLEGTVDMNRVGTYDVVLKIKDKDYNTILRVADTIKPVVEVNQVQIYTTETVTAEDLIASIEDATEVQTAFVSEPDFTVPGVQEVPMTVTDLGGNVTEVQAQVEVVEDTEPPVITGVKELSVPAGNSVSYKRDVEVTDNYDTDVSLKVDNSKVDLNTVGDYEITYIAEDAAGNVTEETTILHVEVAGVENATEDLVNAEADKLLARIINDDMSEYEKAKAIFFWVHENVGYVDHTPKTDWVQGAYRGLVEHRGDCFVYAMTSKCLLTRAGIKNMDIEKIPAATEHYWNLIDIGEGWYHFDNTRRADGHYFFYRTDEEVLAYSRTHNGTHNYDPAVYPDIQ